MHATLMPSHKALVSVCVRVRVRVCVSAALKS